MSQELLYGHIKALLDINPMGNLFMLNTLPPMQSTTGKYHMNKR